MKAAKRLFPLSLLMIILAGCTLGATPAPPSAMPASSLPTAAATTAPPSAEPLPTAAATAAPPSAEPLPTAAAASITATPGAALAGPDIDTFFEESYGRLLLRDPEGLTELGLARSFGLGNDRLTDISDDYLRETQALEAALLAQLRQYDRPALTPEQELSADIYEWYLDDRVRGHAFAYSDYPVNPTLFSVHQDILLWFTDLRPVASRQDAWDYIACLDQVDIKFDQLLDGLRRREAAGVILPGVFFPWLLHDLGEIANAGARATPYYTAFAAKVNALADVSAADKEQLLAAAEQEIAASVIPAYRALVDYFQQVQSAAPEEPGLWQVPGGEDYYAYLLRHYTTTDLSAAEIHDLGLHELERIHAEMRAVFDELGYPQDEDLVTLYARVAQDGGIVYGDEIYTLYETLIADAEDRLAAAFDLRPRAEVIVIAAPTGGYYVGPAVDGSRPGAFYAADVGADYRFRMPSLAYHEAVPGHHYQIALAQEMAAPSFRRGMDFTGYIEGWALYAERLAWELGLYEGDPYGNLGRLQYEALRAARLVADTGIHTQQWTYEQAVRFMSESTGRRREGVEYEVARYSVAPGQATAYYVGYMKILELRQRAQEALGERFDFKGFHNVLLGNGAMPLDVLERIIDEYIQAQSAATPGAGDGVVEGWAILAEKDDYDDVGMTNLPVAYAGLVQMRQLLEGQGWPAGHIRDLREFDRADLEAGLAWLAEEADADDLVLVYVAAHGMYLQEVLVWPAFFPAAWNAVPSRRQVLLVDSCQAANYTSAVRTDPEPFVAIAAVAGDEYGWSGLPEEGLPIIGGVFTHYFVAAFADPAADADGSGRVSLQEAAGWAEAQQRAYMHDVVFAVPEFSAMYDPAAVTDATFPDVIVEDTVGEPLYLESGGQ